jgi:tRNA-modifying protein YgfZ
MNSEWRRFLGQHGAHIDEGIVTNFGDASSELAASANGTTLCDLSHEGLIRAQGEESQTFLQGQLTNDIRTVDEYTHQHSGYCSPKGRLLTLFRVFMRHNEYYLQLPRPLLDNTLKRLRMFVLRSKVTLDDVSENLVRFALSGNNAEGLLGKQLAKLPQGDFEVVTDNGITALRLTGPTPRFILCGENSAMQPLWQALQDAGATPVGETAWQWLQIQAGEPTVVTETVEAFVPQMLNLQQVNGVSFKKGCYTGQEVVARMQYLGKLKRRMYLAHSDSEAPPKSGDELYSPASSSGQGAGRIVSLAPAPQGGYDMLAVLEISGVENSGAFYLDEAQQIALSIHQPPYGFEPVESELPQVTGQ